KLREFHQKNFPGMPQDQSTSLQMLSDLQRDRTAIENSIDSLASERRILEQRREEQRKFKAVMAARAPVPTVTAAAPRPSRPALSRTEQLLLNKREQLATESLKHTDEWPDIKSL